MTAPEELPTQFGAALPALLDALRHAEVGVIVMFHHGGKTYKLYANDAAVLPVGYTAVEWLALPMYVTLAPEMRDVVERLYARIDAAQPLELLLRHRDGSILRGEFTVATAAIESGVVLFLINRDIGHRLQSQLSLLEADRVALVAALAAGFAHEINNPLTSIVLNLRSLRKQLAGGLADPALAQRCVDDVTLAAERIASNVRAMQTLATRSVRDRIDLAAVVASALRLALPTLEPKARSSCAGSSPARASAARSRGSVRPCWRCCCSRARASRTPAGRSTRSSSRSSRAASASSSRCPTTAAR